MAHEYAFVVSLAAVVHIEAHTENDARRLLKYVDRVDINHDLKGVVGTSARITEFVLGLGDFGWGRLFEIDGAEVI